MRPDRMGEILATTIKGLLTPRDKEVAELKRRVAALEAREVKHIDAIGELQASHRAQILDTLDAGDSRH